MTFRFRLPTKHKPRPNWKLSLTGHRQRPPPPVTLARQLTLPGDRPQASRLAEEPDQAPTTETRAR